nr:complex I subunit 5 family protein [uncultured Roseococcus sp.]
MSGVLLLATMLVPLLMLAACLCAGARRAMPRLLWLAPLPGLAAALFAVDMPPVVLDPDRLRFTLELGRPAALLLGVAALLWSAAGAYAAAYLDRGLATERFACWWLLTMAGSLGVFVAGDLVTFYLAFAMVSLSAYGLVIHDRTARAWRAGSIYLLLAVLGEIFLLLGFAVLAVASPGDSIAITEVTAALPVSPWHGATIALLILGFGLKAGMVPLHVWLPLAHPAAPMPASAVLSGAIVKAGIIGLIRFLPWDAGGPVLGEALVVMGFATAFYGVAIGVTQANPKTVLAYSSVSQMGVVMAALGAGLAAGQASAPMDAAFYASHHVLAKGACFLAVGVGYAAGRRGMAWVMVPVLLLVLSFGGFPLTGGALAKAAVKDQLGDGLLGTLSAISAGGTTLLMLHFARRLAAGMEEGGTWPAAGLWLPWLGLTLAAMAIPWALFAQVGSFAEALSPAALWKAVWPMAIGAALLPLLGRLPAVPEGDVLIPAERAFHRAAGPLGRAADGLERVLNCWPQAGLALVLLLLAFGWALA